MKSLPQTALMTLLQGNLACRGKTWYKKSATARGTNCNPHLLARQPVCMFMIASSHHLIIGHHLYFKNHCASPSGVFIIRKNERKKKSPSGLTLPVNMARFHIVYTTVSFRFTRSTADLPLPFPRIVMTR